MAHFHIKRKNGRPYLYVREIARVNGQPKVISQVYLGAPEKVAQLAKGKTHTDLKLKVEEFGALFIAHHIDTPFQLAQIIDEVVPAYPNEKGPSIGEYFLYCIWNRMVEAKSKRALTAWYQHAAIQQIRPVDIRKLNSQRYWEKWDRVSEQDLQKISDRFFAKVWERISPEADCLLFDTTNYYTFMASQTESELVRRGKNKEGRHNLRQIGVALLVSRESRLPVYYKAYPGNMHDSKLFKQLMDEMFGIICGLNQTKEKLTVVIDKGMNSEDNYSWIDEHKQMHFITTYSTYFAEKLACTALTRFEPIDIERNSRLRAQGHPEDQMKVYRTKGVLWGKERTVVVTYNPQTARKKNYTLASKLETMRQELLQIRNKVNTTSPHWKKEAVVRDRYIKRCKRLHVATDLYELHFVETEKGMQMSFRQNVYRIKCQQEKYGKNIIVTDNIDWTTKAIIEANLSRWEVEDRFRTSKKENLVGIQPIRHWTDGKIRCHLFACVVAMTYLRLLEMQFENAGVHRTAEDVMEDMKHLHSVLMISGNQKKPSRKLEQPSKTQSEVLKALGYAIDAQGVLQQISP